MRIFLILFLFASFTASGQGEKPVTLKECFDRAIRFNEKILRDEQEIRAAEGRYWQALGGTLPNLSATGTELIQDTSGTASSGDTFGSTFLRQSTPEVSLTVKQPLFQGLREFRSLSGSKADKKKSRLNYERSRQLLWLETAEVFLSVKKLEKEKGILESQRDVMETRIRELRERVRLGKSRPSEVLTTESQSEILEADLARVKGALEIARETISFVTGIPPDLPLTDAEPAVGELGPLESYLSRKEGRPDLLASEEELILSRASLNYEKGGYLPQLNLEASYYPYRVGFRDAIDWDLLFTLDFPLFQGGKRFGLVKEAKSRFRQAELLRQESRRRAGLEIQEAYHLLTSSREEARFLESAGVKAARNYEMQLKEYRLGLVNNLEVLQALKDRHQIQHQANEAFHRSLLNSYRFAVAIGEAP